MCILRRCRMWPAAGCHLSVLHFVLGATFRPPDLTSKGIMESETTLELKVFVAKTSFSWNNSMQDFLFLLDFVPSYEEAYILFLNFSSQPDGKILTSLHLCKVWLLACPSLSNFCGNAWIHLRPQNLHCPWKKLLFSTNKIQDVSV